MKTRICPLASTGLVALIIIGSSTLAGCIPALLVGGIGTAALVANDRRTTDTVLSDERIEKTINARLKNELGDQGRVNVNTFNRSVLLSGEARTEEHKTHAEHIARQVDGVKTIYNEVDVTAFRTPREQFGDGTTTTHVKARMVGNGIFNPLHVQASTDGGIVFLQGLVTKAEADEAARIAASTKGVRKVVRLFEFMPESAAAR